MKSEKGKIITKRSNKSVYLQATVELQVVKLSNQPALSVAFCYFGFGCGTERNRTQNAPRTDAAGTSSRRGTGFRPSPHGVFVNAARCVCHRRTLCFAFPRVAAPPEKHQKWPFSVRKRAISHVAPPGTKSIVHILSGLHILATFQESCRGVRGLHFRGILRGRAEVRM